MLAFTVQITTLSLPLGAYFISNIFYVEQPYHVYTSVLPPPSPLRAPCSHYCGTIILLVQGNQVKSPLYRLQKYMQTGISQNHSLKQKCIIRHLQRIVISEICCRFPIYFPFRFTPLKENINVTEACPHQQSQGDQEIYVIDFNWDFHVAKNTRSVYCSNICKILKQLTEKNNGTCLDTSSCVK